MLSDVHKAPREANAAVERNRASRNRMLNDRLRTERNYQDSTSPENSFEFKLWHWLSTAIIGLIILSFFVPEIGDTWACMLADSEAKDMWPEICENSLFK